MKPVNQLRARTSGGSIVNGPQKYLGGGGAGGGPVLNFGKTRGPISDRTIKQFISTYTSYGRMSFTN